MEMYCLFPKAFNHLPKGPLWLDKQVGNMDGWECPTIIDTGSHSTRVLLVIGPQPMKTSPFSFFLFPFPFFFLEQQVQTTSSDEEACLSGFLEAPVNRDSDSGVMNDWEMTSSQKRKKKTERGNERGQEIWRYRTGRVDYRISQGLWVVGPDWILSWILCDL